MGNVRKFSWLFGFTGLFGFLGMSGTPAFLLAFAGFGGFALYWRYKLGTELDERFFANARAAGNSAYRWGLVAIFLSSIASSCLFTDPWTLYRVQLAIVGLGFAGSTIAQSYLTYQYDR